MNGGYLPGHSVLHRTDALCKLLCFFLLIAAILLSHSLWGYGAAVGSVLLAAVAGRVGLRRPLGILAKTCPFFLVIFLMNLLFFEADAPLWQWGFLQISAEGALQGARTVLRIIPVLILGDLLLATTTPTALTEGLESLFYPLKFLGVPVQEVAMILGVAMQFIPTLSQEAETLRKAQLARGARFESKKLRERASALLPLVVPLFLSAFRRADELSVAMEARGYRRGRRATPFRKRRFGVAEGLALLLCCGLCALEFFV